MSLELSLSLALKKYECRSGELSTFTKNEDNSGSNSADYSSFSATSPSPTIQTPMDSSESTINTSELTPKKTLLAAGYLRPHFNHKNLSIIPIITEYIESNQISTDIDSFLDTIFIDPGLNEMIESLVRETPSDVLDNIPHFLVDTSKNNHKKVVPVPVQVQVQEPSSNSYPYSSPSLSHSFASQFASPETQYECRENENINHCDMDQISSPHHYHRGDYHNNNPNSQYPAFYDQYNDPLGNAYSPSPAAYCCTPIPPSCNTYPYHYQDFQPQPQVQPQPQPQAQSQGVNQSPAPCVVPAPVPAPTPASAVTPAPTPAPAAAPVVPPPPPSPSPSPSPSPKEYFANMNIRNIIYKNLSLQDLVRYGLIDRFMKDRDGSQYLQRILRQNNGRNAEFFLNHLKEKKMNFASLSADLFANYIISLLFELLNREQQQIMLRELMSNNGDELKSRVFNKLCLSTPGCRVIQNILRYIKNKDDLKEFIIRFEKDTVDELHSILVSCNGNHVIQKLVESGLPHKQIRFITKAVNKNLVEFSLDEYACRVVQSIINCYGDKLDIMRLMEDNHNFRVSSSKLCNNVIKRIIGKNVWYSKLKTFIINFKDKFINSLFKNKK